MTRKTNKSRLSVRLLRKRIGCIAAAAKIRRNHLKQGGLELPEPSTSECLSSETTSPSDVPLKVEYDDETFTKTGSQVTEETSSELCKKIRNSLKQLRQLENRDDETGDGREADKKTPFLQVEILSRGLQNSNGVEENLSNDVFIKEEPTEFYDESETPDYTDEPDVKKSKPTKKNSRRKTKHELKNEQIQNSPMEKVFVSAFKKPDRNHTTQAAKISEMSSDFDHTEELYEFGKYVAEQLMCFDDKEVRLAQAEINEVLSKFRLKYKIMNCLSKPNDTQAEIDRKKRKANKSNGQKMAKFTSQTNCHGPPVPTSSQNESVMTLNGGMSNTNTSLKTPLGFVIEPLSMTGGFNISTQRVDSTGAIVTQPVTLPGSTIRSSVSEPESSISNGVTVKEPANFTSNERSVGELGQSNSISNGTSVTNPESSDIMSNGTSMTHHTASLTDPIQSMIIEPGISNVSTVKTSEKSEKPIPKYEMPSVHFIKASSSDGHQTLSVKIEMESDIET